MSKVFDVMNCSAKAWSARYPERIVCLTEETTETLYLLGEQDRIVGISGFTVRPPQARKEKPKVSAFTSAKIDRIVALKPDLVIGFSDLQADIAKDLVAAGVNVLVMNQRSVGEILNMILTLSSLVGAADKGQALVDGYIERLQRIEAAGAALHTRPRVYFEEWDEPMISAIQWVSELIGIAGGEDCFAHLGQAGWEAITAVQRQALFEVKSPLILQPGPAALTDGLDELHRIISSVA